MVTLQIIILLIHAGHLLKLLWMRANAALTPAYDFSDVQAAHSIDTRASEVHVLFLWGDVGNMVSKKDIFITT